MIFGLYLPCHSQKTASPLLASAEVPSENRGGQLWNPTDSLELRAIKEEASAQNIPMRSFDRLDGVPKGYYIVVGVFRETGNLQSLVTSLEDRGLKAGSLLNPENGLNYVYAQHYEDGHEAVEAAESQVGGKYTKALWLLAVENDSKAPKSPELRAPVKVTELPVPTASEVEIKARTQPDAPPARKSANTDPEALSSNQLLRKANSYFDRMWYADAAQLYEVVLRRYPEIKSAGLIEKTADAHYFNSNMEQAYYWYDQMYEELRDDMPAEYLYKYAQSLKGNGKYGRARRLLKLYDKKLEETPLWRYRNEELRNREVVLDKLLNDPESFAIKNLEVNSEYSDFAPMYYGKGQIVYASSVDSAFFKTRRYKWNEQPYLDLYVARMNEESLALGSAVKFSKEINTKYHEAAVTFSPDRQTMYFTRNNYGKKLRRDRLGVNHLKIYRSQKVNGEWTEAEELEFNGESFSTGHPALSPDGKQLYFVSDRPGTIGDTDIFVVDVLEDGGFSPPKNLGAGVNTEQKEMFPFITEEKLYFSSNGHVGLGGLDVFEASFLEDGGFGPVRNTGKPINSKSDDFSFIIDREVHKGYFASNRRGGKGDDDLYSFERIIPEEAEMSGIAGVVTDLVTGQALPDALVELLDEQNMKLKELVSEEDGSFVFQELDSNTRYRLHIKKESYSEEVKHVQTPENGVVPTEIGLRRLEERIVVEEGIRKIKTDLIYFDFDKFAIRSDAASELDKLVTVMEQYPDMVIKIESHTDSRGPASYNKFLSDKRARATRDYIIQRGIAPERIQSAIGYGEERLLTPCDGSSPCSPADHQQNRRSEFIVVRM